jgi:hypothetical protein
MRAESPLHRFMERAFSPFSLQFIIPSASHWADMFRAFSAEFDRYAVQSVGFIFS